MIEKPTNSNLKIQALQEDFSSEIENLRYTSHPKELYEPIEYILSLGGKRLRPILSLIGYNLFKDDYQHAMPLALAIEIFHNFSLVHDDIMDEAPLRRGKPTVHEKWNANTGILSGDVMLVKAYEELFKLPENVRTVILQKFSKCATEVCEGQQIDMTFENCDVVPEDDYLNMIRLKTAVLLGFSLEAGAITAGAATLDAQNLYDFGVSIGLGFQIKDDLLDVFGEADKVGKQVGGDIISNKKTYLLIKALNESNDSQRKELRSWIDKKEFDPTEKVNAVKSIYEEIGVKEITENKMNEQFNLGFEFLSKVQCDQTKKESLKNFSFNLINREK